MLGGAVLINVMAVAGAMLAVVWIRRALSGRPRYHGGRRRSGGIGTTRDRLAAPVVSPALPFGGCADDLRSPYLYPAARNLAEFEERYEKRLPLREKHSKLGAFWHTEFGPLNQVVHVYPYDDLQHRTRVRAAMAQDAARNALPGGRDLIVAQEAEIMNPAPFMRPLGSRNYGTGNVYEMRTYTYAPGDIPKVLDAWGKAIEAREKFSPLAACWTSELGALNKFTHIWVYKDLNERARVREIPPSRRRLAATGRGPAGPPGKQAADPGDLLTRTVATVSDQTRRAHPVPNPAHHGEGLLTAGGPRSALDLYLRPLDGGGSGGVARGHASTRFENRASG